MRARWTSTGRQRRPARPGETGRGDASEGWATSPGQVGQPVIALMAAHPRERIRITVVPTFVGGHRWRRLAVDVHGMLRATWVELRGWAARLTGVPRSYDFGGRFDRLPPLIQAVLRRVLVADHWVVLGERHVEEYANRLQSIADRISLLRNAVRIPDTPVNQSGVERCTRCGVVATWAPGRGRTISAQNDLLGGCMCVKLHSGLR